MLTGHVISPVGPTRKLRQCSACDRRGYKVNERLRGDSCPEALPSGPPRKKGQPTEPTSLGDPWTTTRPLSPPHTLLEPLHCRSLQTVHFCPLDGGPLAISAGPPPAVSLASPGTVGAQVCHWLSPSRAVYVPVSARDTPSARHHLANSYTPRKAQAQVWQPPGHQGGQNPMSSVLTQHLIKSVTSSFL